MRRTSDHATAMGGRVRTTAPPPANNLGTHLTHYRHYGYIDGFWMLKSEMRDAAYIMYIFIYTF
jgi:hypothetical protein